MRRQQSFPVLIPISLFPGLPEYGSSGCDCRYGYYGETEFINPQAGTNFEMDAIGACFIGGASAYGGTGTVPGVIIGALLMGVLNLGMSIMGIDQNLQKVVKGLVLLAAVIFDVVSKRKSFIVK